MFFCVFGVFAIFAFYPLSLIIVLIVFVHGEFIFDLLKYVFVFLNSLSRFLIFCYFAPFWRCVSVAMLANVRVSKHGLRVWAPYFCAKRYISLVCVCMFVRVVV